MKIVHANQQQLRLFHVKQTCFALVAVDDAGVAHGVGGFYVDHVNVRAVVFAHIDDVLRRYPLTIARAGRALLREAALLRLPVQASADESIPRAAAFLRFLGFAPITDRVYQWTPTA